MQEIIEQILDFLRGIWIKRRYLMVSTWLICPLGWTLVAQMPNIYGSEAKVYVDTQSLLRPLLRGISVETNPEYQIRLMVDTLLSKTNLERIARMADLDVQAKTPKEYKAMIGNLKRNLKIKPAGRENSYRLSINDPDPVLAKIIVQSALTVFIENTLGETRHDSDNAQKFLTSQILEYEKRLTESEAKLTRFKQKNNEFLFSEAGGYYSTLKQEKSRLKEAQLQLRELQSQLKSAHAQLAGEQPVFGLTSNKINTSNSVSTVFDNRIAQLEQSLDALLLRYTNQHPDVKRLKHRLKELNKQRDEEIQRYYSAVAELSPGAQNTISSIDKNPVYQQMKIQVNRLENEALSLNVRVNDYKFRVKDLENKVHIIPEIEAALVALDRGYAIIKKNYDELLDRRETAQIAQQADEKTDKIQFRVIDPPVAASEPSGPPRSLYFIAVAMVGNAVGLGLSLLFSQISPTVTSGKQLSMATGIPIFGQVMANENLGLQRWHRKKTQLFMLSNTLLIILLILLLGYFMFPNLVQIPLNRML
jgi:polysaccharide chain length determinant protein (PEP-CTERM system associated)